MMSMKILAAEERATEFFYRIHIDDTKLIQDGTPDPRYVREFNWGKEPPEGQSVDQYLAAIKREMKLLCEDELRRMTTTPLADQGEAL